jgi:uncharacterized protein DUF1579
MKAFHRTAIFVAAVLGLGNLAFSASPNAAGAQASNAALGKALDNAMTPGEGQKRLEPMIGKFNVKILTWVDASHPPVESQATCVNSWVLGKRYMQMMMSGTVMNEPFEGIGYVAYDNVAKTYQLDWMDNGSTAMTLYQGSFAANDKNATLKATIADPLTGKPSPLELRLSIPDAQGHVSELWGYGDGKKMFKMMELRHTKTSM